MTATLRFDNSKRQKYCSLIVMMILFCHHGDNDDLYCNLDNDNCSNNDDDFDHCSNHDGDNQKQR